MSLHRVCCCNTPNQPRMVRGGWYHFLVLDGDGSVTCFVGDTQTSKVELTTYTNCISDGSAHYCVEECIPISANDVACGHPLAVPDFGGKKVKDIACGAYHNVVRFTDDSIMCWGLNSMGQCNTPATLANGTHAKAKKIVGLHAGYSTTAVSFNDGTVLAWGDPAVCDIVNQWTDLMMSPVNNIPNEGSTRKATDNVDPAKPQYAKPRYSAAYNTDASLVTWNIDSDHTFGWHSETAATHCQPFFDLGCEVNPFVPIEFNPDGGDAGGDVRLPGYLTEFPKWLRDGAGWLGGSSYWCPMDNVSDPTDQTWKDAVMSKWRNRIFQATASGEGSGTRSCCDLTVGQDFAVGMRRTGQLITTRDANRHSSCPTGQTDGRSHCRDCSADAIQQVTDDYMVNPASGCPSSTSTSCVGYPNCTCCDDQYPYYYLGCPNCSGQKCTSDQRFSFPAAGPSTSSCVSGVARFHEGIGCMGSNPHLELVAFDPNWAKPYAGSMVGRWTAGEQVRTSAYSGGPWPVGNVSTISQNWGWSTMPQPDQIQTPQMPQQDCIVTHGTETSCNKLCKDSGVYEGGSVDPQGEPVWRYPMQMFAQGVHAGTDTTVWSLPAIRLEGGIWIEQCASCGQSHACNNLQQYMPNGGQLSYGCIFAGTKMGSGSVNIDKYGYANFYRGGVELTRSPCASSNHLQLFSGFMAPSKPWGPFHIAIFNSVGNDKNNRYELCHCCPGGNETPPPRVARVVNPISSAYDLGGLSSYGLDQILGTYYGMPNEANMHCHVTVSNSTSGTGSCDCGCGSYVSGSPPVENTKFNAIFCTYHAPRSVASTRMAFAMIRADHRALDNGNRMEPLGDCGEYSQIDPSQYVPCDVVDGNLVANPRTDLVVHIWGSLFDPCPPWPRICSCDAIPATVSGVTWESMHDPYLTPCDANHPEGGTAPESLPNQRYPGDPNWTWGPCALYPVWTKVPASNTNRSSSKGHWSGSSWVLDTSPAACESIGCPTRYCPSCADWSTQWSRGSDV